MWRTTAMALRTGNRLRRRVCTDVPPTPTPSLSSASDGVRDPPRPPATPAAAAPPQEPVMPEQHECCGNECGTDCVWSLYFEDQASYLKELKVWEQDAKNKRHNK